VVRKNEKELNEIHADKWPLLQLRKRLRGIQINIKQRANQIISAKPFENISIIVILANSIALAIEDPQAVSTTPTAVAIENIFLGLYTIEMILKITGLGFVFENGAYLKDPWNMLDFTIVSSAYLTVA
jgi:hypothetical protein